jgi:uncharacterized membrane protein
MESPFKVIQHKETKMKESTYWRKVLRVSLMAYVIVAALSLILAWFEIDRPNFPIDLPFEKSARYSSSPEHTYWTGLLAYIVFPILSLYFSLRAYSVEREPHLYRCIKCSHVFFTLVFFMVILFLKNGFSGEKGLFSGIFYSSLTGMYYIYFGIWCTCIFTFEWILISIFSKLRR